MKRYFLKMEGDKPFKFCIDNACTDAYFNIAAEEYFLKNSSDTFLILYRNEPSVIIGKHQQARAEVDTVLAERNRLKIVRRYSGGGAVFHDLGNLNLTFIESNAGFHFDRFVMEMIDMLSLLGIDAIPDSRRGLTVEGRKISGSAQCIYKNRVLYHATLLFSSDLRMLARSLEGDTGAEVGKRQVRSVKSPVANLAEYLTRKMDMADFHQFVINYFLRKKNGARLRGLTLKEQREIERLRNDKYSTREWNYDASVPSDKNKNAVGLSMAGL